MNFGIENGQLLTDLDGQTFNLLNIGQVLPTPANLVDASDPRLSDPRAPIPASVTNLSVDPAAAIDQSKINFNSSIPLAWLGNTASTAAQGDLVEYVANKGVAGGYPSLDGTGKVPAAQMPVGAGLGTVTSVALTLPGEFGITGSPVTGAGTLAAAWIAVADGSWFGNMSGASAAPTFNTSPFPASLIPNLDASKITTGALNKDRLPLAVGLGPTSALGAVPDPGPSTAPGVLSTDYLARDMTYKPIPVVPSSYRPALSGVIVTPSSNLTGPRAVVPSPGDAYINTFIFYSLTGPTGPFVQFGLTSDPSSVGYVSVPILSTVWFYSAAVGYTDSSVVSYTNPNTV